MLVGTLKALFTINVAGFMTGMFKVQKELDKTKKKTDKASKSFKKMSLVQLTAVTTLGVAAVATYRSISRFALEIEGLNRRLEFSTGSAKEAARTYAFIRQESNRLGVSLEASAKQYGSLAAAAKGTAMEGEEVKRLFTSIAEISAVMSLSVHDTELIFLAFQQMMSKGKVVSEEVRRQLGERLPGAFALMAKSIGVTTAELDKLMSTGQLAAEDVLPAFSRQLSEDLSPAVDGLGDSLSIATRRMENAWFELKKGVVESDLLKNSLIGLSKVLGGIANAFISKGAKTGRGKGTIGAGLFGQEDWVDDLDRLGMLLNKDVVKPMEDAAEATETLNTAVDNVLETIQAKFGPEMAIQAARYELMVNVVTESIRKSTDFIADWATGAEVSFKDLTNSIIKDLLRIIAEIHIVGPLMNAFRGAITPNTGGVLGKIFGFAKGGVISEPVFGVGMKSGSGYTIAEKGPEMVTPMSGASSAPAGNVSNNVNVNISALDSRSLTELMQRNPQAVTGPIIQALQSGDRGLLTSMRGSI